MLALDYALRPVLQSLGAGHILLGIYATDAQVTVTPKGAYSVAQRLPCAWTMVNVLVNEVCASGACTATCSRPCLAQVSDVSVCAVALSALRRFPVFEQNPCAGWAQLCPRAPAPLDWIDHDCFKIFFFAATIAAGPRASAANVGHLARSCAALGARRQPRAAHYPASCPSERSKPAARWKSASTPLGVKVT